MEGLVARCILFMACCGAVVIGTYLEPDQSLGIPDGWTHVGHLAAFDDVTLTFALKQQHVDKLMDLVNRVSDPDSPFYGKHLSLQELGAVIKPSGLTLATVRTWLQMHGIEDCQTIQTMDFLQCTMPASTAEKLLPGSEFHRYVKGSQSVVRSSTPYQISEELAKHIDFELPMQYPPETDVLGLE